MVSENSTCTAAREVSSAAAASCSRQQRARERRCAVCGITFKITCNGAETKERFCANQNTKESGRIRNTTTSKIIFLFMETLDMDLRAGPTRKVIRRTSRLCNPQNPHAPPRRDRGCQNTCLYIPLAYVCRSALSREHWRMALSKLEKLCWKGRRGSDRLGP